MFSTAGCGCSHSGTSESAGFCFHIGFIGIVGGARCQRGNGRCQQQALIERTNGGCICWCCLLKTSGNRRISRRSGPRNLHEQRIERFLAMIKLQSRQSSIFRCVIKLVERRASRRVRQLPRNCSPNGFIHRDGLLIAKLSAYPLGACHQLLRRIPRL